MKTRILSCMALVALSSISIWAQPKPYAGKNPKESRQISVPERRMEHFGERLSDEQREEFKKIRMEQTKKDTRARNLLKEKHARLKVLQTADKPDMKEIDKTIDEIASIRAQAMKERAADRQKIRSMLTEEQRIYFDARYASGCGKQPEYRKGRQFDDRDRFRKQERHHRHHERSEQPQ